MQENDQRRRLESVGNEDISLERDCVGEINLRNICRKCVQELFAEKEYAKPAAPVIVQGYDSIPDKVISLSYFKEWNRSITASLYGFCHARRLFYFLILP